MVTQGELDSLRQIYGDGNVRVRAAQARLADLKRELERWAARRRNCRRRARAADSSSDGTVDALYPPLRQLPRLAVPYADLYRTVKVQETVFETADAAV